MDLLLAVGGGLVRTVEAHAAQDRAVLREVTEARSRLRRATTGEDVAERAGADAGLERSLTHLAAVAEGYPVLRSDTTFGELQRQLAEVEAQVAFARQYYNDAVRTLNNLTQTLPWMVLTGVAGVSRRDFYEAPEGHRQAPGVPF